MQIDFQTHYPKQIKGSFIYERTLEQIKIDAIDRLMIEVAENISWQISDESSEINTHSGVSFSDFYASDYHSKKTIKLHLKNKEDNSASPVILPMTVHFDTADFHFIYMRVKDEQIFNLHQSTFNKLNTLIVQ